MRLGAVRATSAKRNNAEADIEARCREHGTTTEGAFRAALAGFELTGFLARCGLSETERELLTTWRGCV